MTRILITNNSQIIGNKRPKLKVIDGIEYEIHHGISMVEGVLNGLLYPAREIQSAPEHWDYTPATKGHPEDADGFPISANSPDAIEQWHFGFLTNSKSGYKPDGRATLEHDFYMNRKKCQSDPIMNAKLQQMRQDKVLVELSTGLYIDIELTEGEFVMPNGERRYYAGIARNFKADHCAVLINEVGASSIADGAGIRDNTNSIENINNDMDKNFIMKFRDNINDFLNGFQDNTDIDAVDTSIVKSNDSNNKEVKDNMTEEVKTPEAVENKELAEYLANKAEFEAFKATKAANLEAKKKEVLGINEAFTTELVSNMDEATLDAVIASHAKDNKKKKDMEKDKDKKEMEDNSEKSDSDSSDSSDSSESDSSEGEGSESADSAEKADNKSDSKSNKSGNDAPADYSGQVNFDEKMLDNKKVTDAPSVLLNKDFLKESTNSTKEVK